MASEILDQQYVQGTVRPEVVKTATDLLLAPTRVADRLRHFPEEVYDLSPESHLSRFMKVLLGDAGVGQLRKRLMLTRMQSTLQGSRFFDLDRFYGALFGLRRAVHEVLAIDPYTATATHEEWDQILSQDASFRSRIEQFGRAIAYGATPTGMELVAEALLSVDCDIYESWIQADSGFQTYQELEDQYGGTTGFYSDMEELTYSTLEGYGLARLSGDERRVFYIRPKRAITLAEAYDLRRVLYQQKPADTRFIIQHQGLIGFASVLVDGAVADSEHWEVISQVTSQPSANNPYQKVGLLIEQPRPPLSGYQGEAWSYLGDLAGVAASMQKVGGEKVDLPTQRYTFPSGEYIDFPSEQAIVPPRMLQAGRVASDAILVAHPYSGARNVALDLQYSVLDSNPHRIAQVYADGMPLDALVTALKLRRQSDPFQQNPSNRYWITPERDNDDETEAIYEVRLTTQRFVNYINLEVSHYPHRVVIEVYDEDGAVWSEVFRKEIPDSYPSNIPHGHMVGNDEGHPLHSLPGHWMKVSQRIPSTLTRQIRVRLKRIIGSPPTMSSRGAIVGQAIGRTPIPYSLGIRGFDVGYRISSRDDFAPLGNPTFEGATDVMSNPVVFSVRESLADQALDGTFLAWRSEPQAINYAVVNFYLDTRGDGDGRVIDRFYLDPTHVGPHMTIYYSMDPEESDGTDEFYAERTWTPIPRDFTLQRGYVHIPTTRARYWKFEFTNLSAEPYETFLTLHRKTRLFPKYLVEGLGGYSSPEDSSIYGIEPAIEITRESRYRDALNHLVREPGVSPTETLYVNDPNGQNRLNDSSWVWGFAPWHQEDKAPRFPRKGVHRYTEVDVKHDSKVGYFVGLREIRAYRSRFEANDDTMVYLDTFDDFRNLTAGFSFAFEPGFLTAENVTLPAEALSRVFGSRNPVKAIQFATVQSPPVQIVPDHQFRSTYYQSYQWDDPDDFLRVGDAQLIYRSNDTTVLNIRYVVAPAKSLTRTGEVVQPVVKPPFLDRDTEIADEAAAAATVGGLATPLLGLSAEGRAYAAVRFTMDTEQSSPLVLQIVDTNNADAVLIEKEITARKGQMVEDFVAYDIPAANMVVRVRLVQFGKSNDAWRVDSLAMFDESMTWEFSNNGGADWFSAIQIKNNENGILTFPEVGNMLRYRVRAFRENVWVSAVKIRPQYVGIGNARMNGTHRGPNISLFDQDVPIQDDPLFTSWTKPIPHNWFALSRRFPMLPVEGVPFVSEFSRFFGRPLTETLTEPVVTIDSVVFLNRSIEEFITGTSATFEWPIPFDHQLVNTIVHPVSGKE